MAKRKSKRPTLGKELSQSMKEAVAWAKGEMSLPAYEYRPPASVKIASVRRRLGMSQPEFARFFGLNLGTLRDWEQGRRQPEGSARTLLAIIARHPEIVHEVLDRA